MLQLNSIYNHQFISQKLKERNFLLTKEVALLLKCSERTLIRWRNSRKEGNEIGIPFTKKGKEYIYFIEDINNYLNNNMC